MMNSTSPTNPRTSILTLSDIKLKPAVVTPQFTDLETVIQAGTLWERQPCLILVLRRPGCLLCREEAAELASYRELIQACNVRMMIVVKERMGVDALNKFWQGEVFLDEAMDFYKAIHGGSLNRVGISAFLGRAIYSNYRRAGAKGYTGDTKGEGRVLGGLYIVTRDRVVYEYPEKISGDHAPLNVVWDMVKSLAPPDTDFAKLPTPEKVGLEYLQQKQKRLQTAQEQSALMLQQYQQQQRSQLKGLERSSSSASMDPTQDSSFMEWQSSIK